MRSWLKRIAKKHWLVFVLALLVSDIYGSHHIFIPRILGPERVATYYPLTFAAHPDAAFYGLRANAVYYGDWRTGDVSVSENADSPWLLPPFGAVLIGGMGRVLGSLDRAFVVSDFLFPPLIFIALYFLAFELTAVRTLSLVFASFFVFIPMALLAFPPLTPSLLRMLVERIMPEPASILYFSRLEYPKTTFLFYASASYSTVRALRRGERWTVWLAGISFGLMFYNYLYDWVYFFIALCLTATFFAMQRNYAPCMRLAKIASIGFLVSLPYWYNMFLLRRLPHYHELEARIGMETGHAFRLFSVWKSYVRSILLGALAVWFAPRHQRAVLWYILGGLGAFFVAVNLQVVLGFNPHPDHWYRISFLPVALAMLFTGYWACKRYLSVRILSHGPVIAMVFITLIMGRSLISQYQYSVRDAQYYALDPAYAAAYVWLEQEAEKNATVAALDFATNNELGLHTAQKTFVLNAVHTTVPDEEIWRRYMRASTIAGMSVERFGELIQGDPVIFHLTHNTYRDNSFDSSFRYDERSLRWLPDDVRERRIAQYRALVAAGGTEAEHDPDYVLVGPREERLTSAAVAKNMRNVYSAGGVSIYRPTKP